MSVRLFVGRAALNTAVRFEDISIAAALFFRDVGRVNQAMNPANITLTSRLSAALSQAANIATTEAMRVQRMNFPRDWPRLACAGFGAFVKLVCCSL
ncbi:hypothetical protein [Roseibium aggregatum]|uniref:hypothetical protein n=1 Tax=Roseibium aggregatum TaxID=187304 RepID=UPI001E5671E7|nr:hypothetical protein [Roseibium aggregatum]